MATRPNLRGVTLHAKWRHSETVQDELMNVVLGVVVICSVTRRGSQKGNRQYYRLKLRRSFMMAVQWRQTCSASLKSYAE